MLEEISKKFNQDLEERIYEFFLNSFIRKEEYEIREIFDEMSQNPLSFKVRVKMTHDIKLIIEEGMIFIYDVFFFKKAYKRPYC